MQAAALIVAAPARYTERMFYGYVPEISLALRGFRYDSITRISLGYRTGAISTPIPPPPDVGFAFGYWTDSEHRVPAGHVLVQAGVRWPLDRSSPQALIAHLQQDMGWPPDPAIAQAHYWPESHCLNSYHDDHTQVVAAIEHSLPEGIALIGSDYHGLRVEDRMEQGQAAANKIADWLAAKS
jgi:protoporphyrinogen oxidase